MNALLLKARVYRGMALVIDKENIISDSQYIIHDSYFLSSLSSEITLVNIRLRDRRGSNTKNVSLVPQKSPQGNWSTKFRCEDVRPWQRGSQDNIRFEAESSPSDRTAAWSTLCIIGIYLPSLAPSRVAHAPVLSSRDCQSRLLELS